METIVNFVLMVVVQIVVEVQGVDDMGHFDESTVITVTARWLGERHSPRMLECQVCRKKLVPGDQVVLAGTLGRRRVHHAFHKRY